LLCPAACLIFLTTCCHTLLAQEPIPLTEPKPSVPQLGQEGGTLTVVGAVSDPSGAAVPGVSVVVTNLATGSDRNATTDSSGRFVVTNLLPGRYRVRAILSGFKEMEKEIDVSPNGLNSVLLTMSFGEEIPRAEPIRKSQPNKPPTDSTTEESSPREALAPSVGKKHNEEPATRSTTTIVLSMKQSDEVEVQEWLNRQSAEHKQLIAMISVRNRSTLAVLKAAPSEINIQYTALRVNQALELTDLERRVKAQTNDRFLGIHRLTANSYIMVFCRE
jgi:Carboxypeptidase regulatory-like domain